MRLTEDYLFDAIIEWVKSVVPECVPVVRLPTNAQEPDGLFVGVSFGSSDPVGNPYYCKDKVEGGFLKRPRVQKSDLPVSVNVYNVGAFDLAVKLSNSLTAESVISRHFTWDNISVRDIKGVARLQESINGHFKPRAQFGVTFQYQDVFYENLPLANAYCNLECEKEAK